MRIRVLRKYGNTFVIPLTSIDMKDLELKEGDEIDIEDLVILNKKVKGKWRYKLKKKN